jgi:ABC-type transporter Mla MlaB component
MNNGSVSQEATAAVVQTGLVAARLPAPRSKLREMVDAGILQLTVDLAGTQMVDSAGIGLLISAHHSVKSREHLANIETDLLSIEQAGAAIDEQVVHRAVKQGAEKSTRSRVRRGMLPQIYRARDCRGAVPPSLLPSTRVRFGRA